MGITPGSDCFGSLGLPLGPGHLCFTEINGACPTMTLPGFLSHATLPFQDLSASVLARQVAKGVQLIMDVNTGQTKIGYLDLFAGGEV